MQLHALLTAIETLDGGNPDALRALAPILQETLLERQAQDAIAAGASRILVRVGIVPPALISAADRLRARGIPTEFVRTTAEVLAQIGPVDRILLVADGLHANTVHYATIVQAGAHSVTSSSGSGAALVTGDSAFTRGLERIDAQDRWAGLAIISGGILGNLPMVPDDWDACSTILRHAIQAGVRRQRLEAALFEQGQILLISEPQNANIIEQVLLSGSRISTHGLGQNLIIAPILRLFSGWIVRAKPAARHYWFAACAVCVASIFATYAGYLGIGIPAAISAGFLAAIGQHVAIYRAAHPMDYWARLLARILSYTMILIIGVAAHLHRQETLYVAILCAFIVAILLLSEYVSGAVRHSFGAGWALPDSDFALIVLAIGAAAGLIGAGAIFALGSALIGLAIWLRRNIAIAHIP